MKKRKNNQKKEKKIKIILVSSALIYLAGRTLILPLHNVSWLVYLIIVVLTLIVCMLKESVVLRKIGKDYKRIFSSYFFLPLMVTLFFLFNLLNYQYSKTSPDEISFCQIEDVFEPGKPGLSYYMWIKYKGKPMSVESTSKTVMRMARGLENIEDYYVKLNVRKGMFGSFYTSSTLVHK